MVAGGVKTVSTIDAKSGIVSPVRPALPATNAYVTPPVVNWIVVPIVVSTLACQASGAVLSLSVKKRGDVASISLNPGDTQ